MNATYADAKKNILIKEKVAKDYKKFKFIIVIS